MIDILFDAITYLALGAFSGLMAGILGLGGGMVVVPGLLYIFNHDQLMAQNMTMHFATGTSLATMIFTSFAAVRAHHKNSHILWPVYQRLVLGIIVGTFIGVVIAQFIPTDWLEFFFGFFLLFIAFKLYTEINLESKHQKPHIFIDRMVSITVGFFSGLLGIGGGTMIIPYLTHTGVSIRKASPIAALCTMTVSIVGTLVAIIIGSYMQGLPRYALGYVYLPAVLGIILPSYFFAPWGVKLTYMLPIKQLKYVFIGLILLVAVSMFI